MWLWQGAARARVHGAPHGTQHSARRLAALLPAAEASSSGSDTQGEASSSGSEADESSEGEEGEEGAGGSGRGRSGRGLRGSDIRAAHVIRRVRVWTALRSLLVAGLLWSMRGCVGGRCCMCAPSKPCRPACTQRVDRDGS